MNNTSSQTTTSTTGRSPSAGYVGTCFEFTDATYEVSSGELFFNQPYPYHSEKEYSHEFDDSKHW